MKSPDLPLAPVPPWPYRTRMDPARQIWELTQQLLADDPERDPAVRAAAYLGVAISLLGRCDPEMAEAVLTAVESVIRARQEAI